MPPVADFAWRQNLLQAAASHLRTSAREHLPELQSFVVLLPNQTAVSAFRLQLLKTLQADHPAIIPPWIGTLKDWVLQYIPADGQYSLINEQGRRLVFVETLKLYPKLFREENKWQVTVALLKLFDELTLQQTDIPDAQTWQTFIRNAYGIDEHRHCNQEAAMVHALWHAWHQQLEADNLRDSSGDYVNRLHRAQAMLQQNRLDDVTAFYLVGDTARAGCEQRFLAQLAQHKQCLFFQHREPDTPATDSYEEFIRQCFATTQANEAADIAPLHERVQAMQAQAPGAVPFSCLLAENEETQVRAIDLQVRQWLLAGQQNIGIICEDRKLARRLRALLDRADVSMQDLSGWSLATTQAATVIERWLQCIEEDFDARPLLDCLKSPFVQALSAPGLQKEKPTEADENEATPGRHQATRTDTPQDDYRYLVYRFEHDIILHENVHSNLQRYREQLLRRQDRLSHWPSASHQQLLDILNRLEAIAAPLQQLQSARKPVNASRYLATLIDSIEQLGIRAAYQQDAAGLRLLQTLDELRLALHYADPVFSWQDFRYWLGSALEEKLFSPQTRSSKVKLMTLEQAELQAFDALIIAAVEPQHFPGKAASSPFFNQAVRQALALGSWRDDYQQRFRKFRQALFAAPTILLTALSEENGEDIAVSPWLEMLLQFHQQVYGEQPLNTQLKKLLASDSNVFRCDTDTLPEPAAAPAPVLAAPLQPEKYSASSHQRLINCPYQFFASDGLKLRPLEEISTELSKADYGERIHTILQCFHGAESPASRYFGVNAFAENITVANREKAQQHLVELSERVFSKDLEDNVLHRSWLQRWLKHIPSYIDWQIKQQENWRIVETEQSAETSLDQTHRLYGRLDRIDAHLTQPGDYAIIDYKTGSSAKQPEIESGEDVQLTTYALLETRAVEVKYLSLDTPGQRVKTGASLAGEQLDELREKTGARLQQLIDSLGQQHPMPAWGDESVCCYCDFAGLCRRQQWRENG